MDQWTKCIGIFGTKPIKLYQYISAFPFPILLIGLLAIVLRWTSEWFLQGILTFKERGSISTADLLALNG